MPEGPFYFDWLGNSYLLRGEATAVVLILKFLLFLDCTSNIQGERRMKKVGPGNMRLSQGADKQ